MLPECPRRFYPLMLMAAHLRSFISGIAIAAMMPAFASGPDTVSICWHITAAGHITLNQPAALARLLEYVPVADPDDASERDMHNRSAATRSGYRVQVFDDNNPRTARSNAEAAHRRLSAEFPEMRSYISFNSPYWRVKAGDFRTRAEAEAAMAEIQRLFPGYAGYIRIVRDKINVND